MPKMLARYGLVGKTTRPFSSISSRVVHGQKTYVCLVSLGGPLLLSTLGGATGTCVRWEGAGCRLEGSSGGAGAQGLERISSAVIGLDFKVFNICNTPHRRWDNLSNVFGWLWIVAIFHSLWGRSRGVWQWSWAIELRPVLIWVPIEPYRSIQDQLSHVRDKQKSQILFPKSCVHLP